jgi:tetratricopeptide (TPR) repeat protein
MVEFIERTYGWDALCKLLFSYAEGIREEEAMQRAFGVGRDAFFLSFKEWAAAEVRAWGLAPEPSMRELALRLTSGDDEAERELARAEIARLSMVARAWSDAIGRPGGGRFTLRSGEWPARPMPKVEFDDATVQAFLAEFPEHPDLVEILVRRARAAKGGGDAPLGAVARALLYRYARLRPVDPMPHRLWASMAVKEAGGLDAAGDAAALRHLRELDLRADKDNVYALAIARNRRAAGDFVAALSAVDRAVRMNPFDASVRELAAAIAVEAGRLERAELHIAALVELEPDRPVHRQRLERVRGMRAQTVSPAKE